MTDKRKTTVPGASVGADAVQPLSKNHTDIITNSEQQINLQAAKKANNFGLNTVSMTELYDTVYPPRKPIVNDLLYSGTYLFVGAPKVGKSFFMGQLAYHVAMGLPLWDYEVHQGTVLYLALEDDYARLQRRLSRMFGVEETSNLYNAKQTRKDRCISDYYEHLRTGKQEKTFHELIVQIGNKDDMGVLTENGKLAKELLNEYMQGFQERNPTLRVFGAFLHMDEATPHLHIDFVPYVSGWKGKGLDTKVSLKQALKALGFAGGSKRESELNQWINAEKEQLAKVMERHGIEWEQKGTHEEHLSVLDFKKQERTKEVAALEAAKQECQANLAEMQEQLETVQTAADAAEQRAQQANKAYQKQSKELNKLAPIMEGLESLSAQYSQRPEEWVPEAGTFETAKNYREKKAVPLIKKLVQIIFSLHRKYWEVKHDRDKYQGFYRSEKDANRNLSKLLEQAEAENEQLHAMKRDFGRVWNYFGAEKMNQVIGLMREQEQIVRQNPQKSKENSVEL